MRRNANGRIRFQPNKLAFRISRASAANLISQLPVETLEKCVSLYRYLFDGSPSVAGIKNLVIGTARSVTNRSVNPSRMNVTNICGNFPSNFARWEEW